MDQYKRDRDPRELIFQFGRCIAHFALDDQQARFCTHLRGKQSWFLPFDKGWNDGAGNPPNPNGVKTDYLWKRTLSRVPDSDEVAVVKGLLDRDRAHYRGAPHAAEELLGVGLAPRDKTLDPAELADLSRISRNLKRLEGKTNLRGSELQPIQDDISHCLTELRVIIDNARPSVLATTFSEGRAHESA